MFDLVLIVFDYQRASRTSWPFVFYVDEIATFVEQISAIKTSGVYLYRIKNTSSYDKDTLEKKL